MAPPSQGFDLMAAFGLVEKEYASIRGVAMEPSAFGPTRTFTLFKDSQLTRRARWELGRAREQEDTRGSQLGRLLGAHGLRESKFHKLINLLEVGWEGFPQVALLGRGHHLCLPENSSFLCALI